METEFELLPVELELPVPPELPTLLLVLGLPALAAASEPDAIVLVELLEAVVDAPTSIVLFELPVPLPPEMLAVSCAPDAVEPVFALPVPPPPPVAVPAADPFVPLFPEPEPSVLVPLPIELLVEPVVEVPAAVLVADEPPAPSFALRAPPEEPPPLETPAPLPTAPPLPADVPAEPLELLWPEFSLDCEPAEFAAVCEPAALRRLSP